MSIVLLSLSRPALAPRTSLGSLTTNLLPTFLLLSLLCTLIVDIDPALVKCIIWFNSQTIRVPFASATGTTSYLTIGPRDHGMNRAIAAVQNGYDDPRFGTPGHTWDELAAVITNH